MLICCGLSYLGSNDYWILNFFSRMMEDVDIFFRLMTMKLSLQSWNFKFVVRKLRMLMSRVDLLEKMSILPLEKILAKIRKLWQPHSARLERVEPKVKRFEFEVLFLFHYTPVVQCLMICGMRFVFKI